MMLNLYHIMNAAIIVVNLEPIKAKIAVDKIKHKTKNLFRLLQQKSEAISVRIQLWKKTSLE